MQSKKHIVIILYFNSPMGGLHLNVLDTVNFLSSQNILVTVIAKQGVFLDTLKQLNINVIDIDFDMPIKQNVEYIIQTLKNPPTILHTHPFKAKDIAIGLSKHYKIPSILTLHSINDNSITKYEKNIDIFISVSDLVRDYIIGQTNKPEKVFTIPNGIDSKELDNVATQTLPQLDIEYKTILTVSRYDSDKNFLNDSIIYALKNCLKNKIFDFNWIFIGDGSELSKIESLAIQINKLANRQVIHILGWKDPSYITSIYNQIDIFIGPGRSLIEALYFGIPSIAIGSKGYVGIINDENYLHGIYTNFGGDKSKLYISLLYSDFLQLLNLSSSKLQSLKRLSKAIYNSFFDLNNINHKLLNIYEMQANTISHSHKEFNEIIKFNKLYAFENNNFFLKGEAYFNQKTFSLRPKSINDIIYLIAGNSSVNSIPNKDYTISYLQAIHILLRVKIIDAEVKLFVIEFDKNKKIDAKPYNITNGFNQIKHHFNPQASYWKIAFRILFKNTDSLVEFKKINLTNKNLLNYIPNIQNIDNRHKFYVGEYTYSFYSKYNSYVYYTNYKPKSKKFIVAFSGAVDREKRTIDFQRFSWSYDSEYSWIVVPDPTIRESNDLSIGWYQGHANEFAIEKIANILKQTFQENNIDEKNIIFLGSSAGGFAALKMAEYFHKSKVIAINPQIYINVYYKNPVQTMYKVVFKECNEQCILDRYKNRLQVSIDYSKREEKIFYIQNTEDTHHYTNHLLPYLDTLDQALYNIEDLENYTDDKKLNVWLYKDSIAKHTPPSKEQTISILSSIIENKGAKQQ